MSGSFENLNKQIASFIIVSAALSAPVSADNVLPANYNLLADASINLPAQIGRNEIIAMYAAPQIPIIEQPIVVPAPVLRYASPNIPQPIPNPPPAISMYAVVEPIIEPVKPIPAPIVRYASPTLPVIHEIKPLPDIEKIQNKNGASSLNESALNINKVSQSALPSNINTAGTVKSTNSNVGAQSFVLTDYGQVRIIEPFSHIIFK